MPTINNPNATIHSLLLTGDNSPADGQTTNTVVAQVYDGDVAPLSGQMVTFDVDEGASIQSQVESNEQGFATATLTSTTAGVYTVTASINDSQKTVSSTFVPSDDGDGNNPNAVIESLYVSRDNAQADGAATNEVTAEVTDGDSGLLANQSVTFEADNGAVIQSPVLTDELGKARATLTSTEAMVVTVTATINASSSDVEVVFDESNSNDPTAYLAVLQTTDNNAVADGTTMNKVTAEVVGEGGKLLADQSVTFTVDNGAEIVSPGLTNTSGKATTTLTSLTSGKATVTASINDSSLETEVNFVEDGGNDPTAFISFFMVTEDDAVANGIDANEVTAEIVSGDNRLLAGQSVDFQVTNGAVVDSPVVTNPQGKAVTTLTSMRPGLSTVTALINNSKKSLNVVFTEPEGNDPTAEISSLRTLGDLAAADGQATNSVMVEVVDSNNVLLANQSVTFTATNDAVIVSPVLTDEHGKATTTLTSTVEGPVTVTAAINASTRSTDVTFSEGDITNPDAVIAGVYIGINNAVADGVAVNTVMAEVVDGDNRLLANQSVRFEADNGAVIQVTPVMTDERGKATASVSSLTTGACQVTASINDSTESTTINFVEWGGNDPEAVIGGLLVARDNAQADGIESNEVTVTVIDGDYHALAAQEVLFEADNGAVIQESARTDTAGKATTTLTNTTAGPSTVTASINDSTESVVVSFLDEHSTDVIDILVSDKAAIYNDGKDAATLTVSVLDVNNEMVAGATVTWSTTLGTLESATSETDVNGQAQVMLTADGDIGNAVVTATLDNGDKATSTISVQDVAETYTIIDLYQDNILVNDGVNSADLRAIVLYRDGAPVSHNSIPVYWETTLGTLRAATIQTDQSGWVDNYLTDLGDVGTAVVTARLDNKSQVTFIVEIIDKNATLSLSALTTDKSAIMNNGVDSATVTATVMNQGEPVGGETVTWQTSPGALSEASTVTGADGKTRVTLTDVGDKGDCVVVATLGNDSHKELKINILEAPRITGVYDDVGETQQDIQNYGTTDDMAPTLRGTAEAGGEVTLYRDGTSLATLQADDTGQWRYTVPVRYDGVYHYTVTTADDEVHTASEEFVLTIANPHASTPIVGAMVQNGTFLDNGESKTYTSGGLKYYVWGEPGRRVTLGLRNPAGKVSNANFGSPTVPDRGVIAITRKFYFDGDGEYTAYAHYVGESESDATYKFTLTKS
ncbi:Ig-like domain-containing protein [Serratia quinivorans]|nr:Ig-like domain-containing protein [Serratia quinivorans]CAI2031647.1 Invasin [Serratia quinivorans]